MTSHVGDVTDLVAAAVTSEELVSGLLELADGGRLRDVVWLFLALLHDELPHSEEVARTARQLRLDGAASVLEATLGSREQPLPAGLGNRVVAGATLVDLHHTSTSGIRTGIQRVTIETVCRWSSRAGVRLVGWHEDLSQLRDLTTEEHASFGLTSPGEPAAVLVPWHCAYLLPEVIDDRVRSARLAAMGKAGVVTFGAVAYDLIPVTGAETTSRGVPSTFASHLSVVKRASRVAAISSAAANEYVGFREMLAGQGLTGPEVCTVPLPVESVEVTSQDLVETEQSLDLQGRPLVLCVGTHEPRKNHLAVLHACEVLWRQGHDFVLGFIGSEGWKSAEFFATANALALRGRPVRVVSKAPEAFLWSAYRLARLVVFPSLHEGFGLPVAEAFACGTPVVTSDLGSLRELAEPGGALLVDPHDDAALAHAVARLLSDDALHAQLVTEARARPLRSWDDYADEAWAALTGDPACG